VSYTETAQAGVSQQPTGYGIGRNSTLLRLETFAIIDEVFAVLLAWVGAIPAYLSGAIHMLIGWNEESSD